MISMFEITLLLEFIELSKDLFLDIKSYYLIVPLGSLAIKESINYLPSS